MRIRKRSNSKTDESSGAQRPGGGSSHHVGLQDEVVEGDHTRAAEGIREEMGMSTRPSPTLVVDLCQSGKENCTSYMNLDEFVNYLARENRFPTEEQRDSLVSSDDPHFERLVGGNSSGYQSSWHVELDTSLRLGQASHPAMATRDERGKGIMEFESDPEGLASEFHVKRREDPCARYGASGDAALEGRSEKNTPPPSPIEACDESDTARRTVSNLEVAPPELHESSPSDHQTMKSSTESMEPWSSRKRRVSSATDRPKRRRLSSPAPTTTEDPQAADHPARQPRRSLMFSLYTVYHEAGQEGLTAKEAMSMIMERELPGFEDSEYRSRRHVTKLLRSSPYFMELGEGRFALCSAMIDEEQDDPSEEAATSDSSRQQAESSKRPGANTLPVSSSPLATDNEKRKQEVEPLMTVNESGGGGGGTTTTTTTATTTTAAASLQPTERKPSGRSGRPKRLKYLKQDNVEELGNQCNRSDGKGWTCPLLAKTGYQLCDHHLDKLRCKPGSRSKYNKKKKKKHN